MNIQTRASAPAKVILLGEHFVVHGEPAIVLAIDRRATVTAAPRKDRKIWITSKTLKASGYFFDGEFHAKEGGETLERLVHAARRAGALGAKLTGAGGGGCMIALTKPENLQNVADAVNQAGSEAFITGKTMEGVRLEE